MTTSSFLSVGDGSVHFFLLHFLLQFFFIGLFFLGVEELGFDFFLLIHDSR